MSLVRSSRTSCRWLLAGLAWLCLFAPAFAAPGDEATKPETTDPAKVEPPPAEPTPPPTTPKAGAELPWVKKKATKDPLPIIRPPTGVREILDKYDIGESQLEGFFNGQPLSVAEEEVIVRI